MLLLTLRGTPFLYAGEELGLEDARIPCERCVDPGGRDGCRAPLPWDGSPAHGWPLEESWLPWPPDADDRNASSQRQDPGSIVHLYRRLLAARRASAALTSGTWAALDSPDGVLAYERVAGDDRRTVLVSFAETEVDVDLRLSGAVVEVSSDGVGEGAAWRGRVGVDQAVVLRPG